MTRVFVHCRLRDSCAGGVPCEEACRDAWEGHVKFASLNYELQHAFTELMTEWSPMLTEGQLTEEGGANRFL